MNAIPVICDRCRTAGTAGQADFAHLGDLLDFSPVPRKTRRVDGWTAERQRAFIAALSATGSKRQAALAIGMAAYGIDQLFKAKGSDSFKAAFARATAIAAQHGSMKLAQGVADAAARNAQLTPPSRLRDLPPPAEAEPPEDDPDFKLQIFDRIAVKYLRKVQAEREDRLAGDVVAADFALRQVTALEVALDLMAGGLGYSAFELLARQSRGGRNLFAIAETDLSRFLDAKRRELWEKMAEPERPEHPPRRWLTDRGTFRTEERRRTFDQRGPSQSEQDRKYRAACRKAAEEQIEWEAKATRDYAERRDRDASA